MANMLNALLFVLCVNGLFFIANQTLISDSTSIGFTCENSLFNKVSNCNYTLSSDATSKLPSGQASVDPTTNAPYTDTYITSRNWIIDSNFGLDYVFGLLSAPYDFMKMARFPSEISFVLATIWYGTILFIIISFILGKGGE